MKTKLFLIPLLLLHWSLWAQNVWTVRSVPNTRLESNAFHVSDPDDIISDSCEQLINTSLSAIREKADVFIVALNSIGGADIETFANELFNYWGIGDKDKNNGVLILLAKEQRELKFEVGYGVESILTDARCQKIFQEDIVPYFKAGDYQSGICSGVNQVLTVFGGTVPDGLITQLPSRAGGESSGDDIDIPLALLGLLLFGIPIFAGIVFIKDCISGKKRSAVNNESIVDGVRYVTDKDLQWSGNPWEGAGCLKALLYGLSIFVLFFFVLLFTRSSVDSSTEKHWVLLLLTLVVYLSWVCFRQNMRALRSAKRVASQSLFAKEAYKKANNDKLTKFTRVLAFWMGWIFNLKFQKKIEETPECMCADCQTDMQPFNRFHFSELQQKELELKSVSYQPYICQYGHVTVLKNVRNIGYQYCPTCHGYTEKAVDTKLIKSATYEQSGLKQFTYYCCYCKRTRVEEKTIPMLVRHTYYNSSSYSSSSSHSYSHSSSSYSSHKSGGSFGGGHSGGGGYKGSW